MPLNIIVIIIIINIIVIIIITIIIINVMLSSQLKLWCRNFDCPKIETRTYIGFV